MAMEIERINIYACFAIMTNEQNMYILMTQDKNAMKFGNDKKISVYINAMS